MNCLLLNSHVLVLLEPILFNDSYRVTLVNRTMICVLHYVPTTQIEIILRHHIFVSLNPLLPPTPFCLVTCIIFKHDSYLVKLEKDTFLLFACGMELCY